VRDRVEVAAVTASPVIPVPVTSSLMNSAWRANTLDDGTTSRACVFS
jgi:hypothetical protein